MSIYTSVRSCRLCSSKRLKKAVLMPEIQLTEKYFMTREEALNNAVKLPIDLYVCEECCHAQITDIVKKDILWGDFTFWSGQTAKMREHLLDVATWTQKFLVGKDKPHVLDVGSNDGTFLKNFPSECRVLGVDPAKEIARYANNDGVPTICEFFDRDIANQIIQNHGKFDSVTCLNAFAHCEDMNEFFDAIKNVLKPDGIFVFEASYLLDIVNKMLLGTIIHEHMSHHHLLPLCTFFEKHGFELFDIFNNDYQGGSVLGAVAAAGQHPMSNNLKNALQKERDLGFSSTNYFSDFNRRLTQLRYSVKSSISHWKSSGSTIAAYGASRSSPTLLSLFGIEEMIDCVFDDHAQKQDKFVGGYGFPVLNTKMLTEVMPDFTLVTAWSHLDVIIDKNKEYTEKGGKFVSICPEFRVI
jgi:SAM-dependent methyltransferase